MGSTAVVSTGRAVVKRMDEFKDDVAPMIAQVGLMLPKYGIDRLRINLLEAATKAPEIMEADRKSLYLALMKVARWRLDIGEGVHLVCLNLKQKDGSFKKTVEAWADYHGLKALAKREGVMRNADEKVIYQGEKYEYEEGAEPRLRHQPVQGDKNRPQVAAYSIILLPRGLQTFNFMWIEQIEAIRAKSRSWSPDKGYKNPIAWYSCKTVFRDWINRQPKTGVLAEAFSADDVDDDSEVRPAGVSRDGEIVAGGPMDNGFGEGESLSFDRELAEDR